jgi:hypothetical protein
MAASYRRNHSDVGPFILTLAASGSKQAFFLQGNDRFDFEERLGQRFRDWKPNELSDLDFRIFQVRLAAPISLRPSR